jgi:hypothetical protein
MIGTHGSRTKKCRPDESGNNHSNRWRLCSALMSEIKLRLPSSNSWMTKMTTLNGEHRARSHAATFALMLLADENSLALDRSVVSALFRVGLRGCSHANASEWALLHLVDHIIAMARDEDGKPKDAISHQMIGAACVSIARACDLITMETEPEGRA